MANVEIRNLTKSYGDMQVMHGIDVDIEDQSFVALVGPSGCGKSTLLRMIAGLEDVTSGDINIDGARINDVAPRDRDIAMVFQNYALYPHMTVAQNIGFALKLAKVSPAEIKAKIEDAARTLNLTEYLDRHPRQLSGGQRQRVAMGRAIVRQPKVFLFDEPLSNLDAKLRVRMRTEIKALHQRLNATSVYVTHDQIEAMTMADKIVVMREGLIEQVGSPLELYDRPGNIFVATFIGSPSINIVDGVVVPTGIEISKDCILPLPADAASKVGEAIKYGIRPEHLEVAENGIPFTVSFIEPTGSETIVTGHLGGFEMQLTLRDRLDLKQGQTITVMPRQNAIHLFDAQTEQRL